MLGMPNLPNASNSTYTCMIVFLGGLEVSVTYSQCFRGIEECRPDIILVNFIFNEENIKILVQNSLTAVID